MGSMLFSAPIIASLVPDCHQILRKSCQESVRKGLKYALQIGLREISADVEQGAGIGFGDFVRKAVTKVPAAEIYRRRSSRHAVGTVKEVLTSCGAFTAARHAEAGGR